METEQSEVSRLRLRRKQRQHGTGLRSPNIVLIVSDDQGYNDLGVLGDHILTPHLDRIAREGVRLTDFYVAWPACTPSRGALLTGRYPQRNGIYDMIRNEAPDYGHQYTPEEYAVTWERIGGMDTREILLPSLLKQAGYYSGIFGKWDLGMHRRYLPLARGWDEFYGFVNTGIDYYTHERYGVPSMYRNNQPTTEDRGTYCTDLFRREACDFWNRTRTDRSSCTCRSTPRTTRPAWTRRSGRRRRRASRGVRNTPSCMRKRDSSTPSVTASRPKCPTRRSARRTTWVP
jgi:arylsulfatase A-like enzyme